MFGDLHSTKYGAIHVCLTFTILSQRNVSGGNCSRRRKPFCVPPAARKVSHTSCVTEGRNARRDSGKRRLSDVDVRQAAFILTEGRTVTQSILPLRLSSIQCFSLFLPSHSRCFVIPLWNDTSKKKKMPCWHSRSLERSWPHTARQKSVKLSDWKSKGMMCVSPNLPQNNSLQKKKYRKALNKNLPFPGSAKRNHHSPPASSRKLSVRHCKLIGTLPSAVKTFYGSIPSNILDVLTTRSLLGGWEGGRLLSEREEKSHLCPAAPSAAVLAVIDFRLPPLLFDLDYVLSAGAQGRARQQSEIWGGNSTQEQTASVCGCVSGSGFRSHEGAKVLLSEKEQKIALFGMKPLIYSRYRTGVHRLNLNEQKVDFTIL